MQTGIYSCLFFITWFGAYDPIMFARWVWVGFRASWRGGPLCENYLIQLQVWKNTYIASCLEEQMASCSEGQLLRIVFGRTHCIMLEGHFSEYDETF